jgi:hypothetical protein
VACALLIWKYKCEGFGIISFYSQDEKYEVVYSKLRKLFCWITCSGDHLYLLMIICPCSPKTKILQTSWCLILLAVWYHITIYHLKQKEVLFYTHWSLNILERWVTIVNLLEDINIWQGCFVLKESDETITTYLVVFSQASNGTLPDVNIRIVSANMNKDKHMYI